jgi:hypothetical protein
MNGIRVAQRFVDERVLESMHGVLTQLDVKISSVETDGGNGWSRAFEKKSSNSKKQDGDSKRTLGGEHGRD